MGLYLLQVKAWVLLVTATQDFTLTVTDICQTSTLSRPFMQPFFNYEVSAQQLVISFDKWTVNDGGFG